MAARARGRRQQSGAPAQEGTAPRELIVVTRPEAGLRVSAREGIAAAAADTRGLDDVLRKAAATLLPLFGASEERLKLENSAVAATSAFAVPDLSLYYRVEAPEERLDELAEALREQETVVGAYVKPPTELPDRLNDMAPAAEEAPPATPDFTARQAYLDPPPAGINARFAWTRPGGNGTNVRIIDIEGAWRFTHEDLIHNQGGVVGGVESGDIRWRNHGTAVIGEFGGDRNALGVTGICPDAMVSAVSIFGGMGSAPAIRHAANRLRAGDIILIELHRPGPRRNFEVRDDQLGYIAIEWWPDDFDAIRFATSRGIIVVEAAGNGAENLDDALYNAPAPGFPAGWTNPFNRANRDSGAVVVGAGAPPPGTHGRDHGPDRSRLDFSNFGAIVDAQGWGREVTTCAYGDLQGGVNEDLWYTDRFSGTSSASPIVVGALGCVQGMLMARNRPLFTPARARQCLRSTGTAQQDAPGRPRTQRIGNRPDIRALFECAGGKLLLKDVKDKEIKDKDAKELKDAKEKDKEKEKDVKELKEFKDKDAKEFKEFKEGKEKDKDIFERVGKVGEVFRPAAPEADLAARVAQLEGAVAQLTHFIGQQLRPDLRQAALAHEPDAAALEAMSAELEKQAVDAKGAKDNKDVEKTRDG
jgi:hypothetical protein